MEFVYKSFMNDKVRMINEEMLKFQRKAWDVIQEGKLNKIDMFYYK